MRGQEGGGESREEGEEGREEGDRGEKNWEKGEGMEKEDKFAQVKPAPLEEVRRDRDKGRRGGGLKA